MFVGKEGWFFLKTDNDVLDQVRGLNRFTDADLDAWIDLDGELQQRWVESQGAAFIIVIAPNSHTIYREHLPSYVNRAWPETRLDQIMRRIQERGSKLTVVDPRRDLWAAKQQALLYHKYEDHWEQPRDIRRLFGRDERNQKALARSRGAAAFGLCDHARVQSLEHSAARRG